MTTRNSGVTNGAVRGQPQPSAAGEEARNRLAKNVIWLTVTKFTKTNKVSESAKSCLPQQNFTILIANLFRH